VTKKKKYDKKDHGEKRLHEFFWRFLSRWLTVKKRISWENPSPSLVVYS